MQKSLDSILNIGILGQSALMRLVLVGSARTTSSVIWEDLTPNLHRLKATKVKTQNMTEGRGIWMNNEPSNYILNAARYELISIIT